MNNTECKSVDEQHSGTKSAKLLNPQGMALQRYTFEVGIILLKAASLSGRWYM